MLNGFFHEWNLQYLEANYKIPDNVFQDEKKKVRIAVIDNEQVENFADNLHDAGYGVVTALKNINSLEDVENFDLILMDIKGIGLKYLNGTKSASLEGLAMAQEIKRLYPSKKVIVFSAMMQDYKDHAIVHNVVDDYFVKDEDISERNRKIDDCIRARIDPVNAWKRDRQRLLDAGVSIHAVARLEGKVVQSIIKKEALSAAKIEKIVGNTTAVAKIIAGIAELIAVTMR